MIWDIDPKLPWHAAFALVEIFALGYAIQRWPVDRRRAVGPLATLLAAAIGHVVYTLYFASEHTHVGPYPLPWHGVFVLVEVAVAVWLFRHWRRTGKLTFNEVSWLLLAGGAHAVYALKMAEDNPTFDLEIRWYGVFFAIGLLGAARAFPLYFQRWGYPRKHGEELCLWTPVGMLLGAHFVHLIFYETETFLRDPIRIFQLGSGLASHGGGIGAILGVYFFVRSKKESFKTFVKYLDPSMCAATWVIPWVRVGNFFNSEIVGREWDGPWAVVFPRHDCPGYPERTCAEIAARHPSQVYEAILAFVMVGLAVYLQRVWRNRLRPGAIIFILLAYYFTTRFFIEYVKEFQGNQAPGSEALFTTGQLLSLPIVLFSLYMLFFSKSCNIRTPYVPEPEPEKPAKPKKRAPKEPAGEPEEPRSTRTEEPPAEPGEAAPPAARSSAKRKKKKKKK